MLERYISYDIKGIQRSIFSTPKLLTIVGGSALIEEFDKTIAYEFIYSSGVELIFSGGGKGIFRVASEEATLSLIEKLVKEAHKIGVSIRIANENSFKDAISGDNTLYPFIPDNLEGNPCKESGLYPVKDGGIHDIIKERVELGKKDPVGLKIIYRMKLNKILPEELHGKNIKFFNSIDAEGAIAGDELFKKRKRWAVIAMDGNDIGKQFEGLNGEIDKIKVASNAIKESTLNAFVYALSDSLNEYIKNSKLPEIKIGGKTTLILPFRPLILGGDDLLLITHTSIAMHFVRQMVHYFEKFTQEANIKAGNTLWQNTDFLTISAGVVYIGVKYPLYSAIKYAEELLAGAKAAKRSKNQITPSSIDWENITEGFIDTPAERRYRELVFIDEDLDGLRIELTCRPYTFIDLNEKLINGIICKDEMKDVSHTVALNLNIILKEAWAERVLALSGFVRHENKWLSDYLDERDSEKIGKGWLEGQYNGKIVRKTMILDALLIMEEEHRLKSEVN